MDFRGFLSGLKLYVDLYAYALLKWKKNEKTKDKEKKNEYNHEHLGVNSQFQWYC